MEDPEFMVALGYRVSLRPVWDTGDPIYKEGGAARWPDDHSLSPGTHRIEGEQVLVVL